MKLNDCLLFLEKGLFKFEDMRDFSGYYVLVWGRLLQAAASKGLHDRDQEHLHDGRLDRAGEGHGVCLRGGREGPSLCLPSPSAIPWSAASPC